MQQRTADTCYAGSMHAAFPAARSDDNMEQKMRLLPLVVWDSPTAHRKCDLSEAVEARPEIDERQSRGHESHTPAGREPQWQHNPPQARKPALTASSLLHTLHTAHPQRQPLCAHHTPTDPTTKPNVLVRAHKHTHTHTHTHTYTCQCMASCLEFA